MVSTSFSTTKRNTPLTTSGTWLRDFVSSYPAVNHTLVGTGSDPSHFPADPPPGTSYHVQDINKPWPEEWKGTFDFVHQGLTLVAVGPAQKAAVENIAALVKPGGWIQLMEGENKASSDNGPEMQNFYTLTLDIFKAMGAKLTLMQELPGWLREAGFSEVHDRLINTPLGATNAKPQLAKQGVYSTALAAKGLIGFAKSKCSTVSEIMMA